MSLFIGNVSADVIVDQILFDSQNLLKKFLIFKGAVFYFNLLLFRKFAQQILAYVLFIKRSFSHDRTVSFKLQRWFIHSGRVRCLSLETTWQSCSGAVIQTLRPSRSVDPELSGLEEALKQIGKGLSSISGRKRVFVTSSNNLFSRPR